MRSGGGPAIRASPCYGAAGLGPASTGEAGQQGEPPAGPLGAVAEEGVVGRGGAAVDDVRRPGRRRRRAAGGWPPPGRRASGPDRRPAPPRRPGGRGRTASRQRLPHLVGDLVAVGAHGGPEEGADPPGSAPESSMARSGPRRRPRPRCRASRRGRRPGRRASGSTSASGTQSATRMASVTPGRRGHEDVGVGHGVVLGARAAAPIVRPDQRPALAPWTCRAKTRSSSVDAEGGRRPRSGSARRSRASSPTCRPRLSVSYGAAETPPCRVVTATSTPSPGAPSQRRSGTAGGSGTAADPTERTTATAGRRRRGQEAWLSSHTVVGTTERSGRPGGRRRPAAARRSRRARPCPSRGRAGLPAAPAPATPRTAASDCPASKASKSMTSDSSENPWSCRRRTAPSRSPVAGAVEAGAAAQRRDGGAAQGLERADAPGGRPVAAARSSIVSVA